MIGRAGALVFLTTVACAADNPRVEPSLDLPPAGSDADPFVGIDSLRLSVAEAGRDQSMMERTVAFGESLALADVPFGSDLVVHLRGLRGTDAEVSYGRTCAFDATNDEVAVPNPRLYFSRIAAWGPAPDPILPTRSHGHALSAPDGSAVLLGGTFDQTSVERFDPLESGAFAEVVGVSTAARVGSVAAPLGAGDSSWVVVGGVDEPEPDTANAVAIVEVVDVRPGLAPDRVITSRVGPRLRSHAAAALVDGDVVVVGGEAQTADGAPFEVTGKAWLLGPGVGGELDVEALAPELAAPRCDHTLTRLGSEAGADVLIVGGRDAAGDPVATTELYRPLLRTFETVEGAVLGTPRWSHAAVRMPGGFVLVIGGLTTNPLGGEPVAVAEMELYDPVQGRFSPAGSLPPAAGVTGMSVTLLPDGRVLMAGGLDVNGQPSQSVHIARFDPFDGQVFISPTSDLSIPRIGHAAVSLCDGTVLVVGGTTDPASGAERYNPPSEGRQ